MSVAEHLLEQDTLEAYIVSTIISCIQKGKTLMIVKNNTTVQDLTVHISKGMYTIDFNKKPIISSDTSSNYSITFPNNVVSKEYVLNSLRGTKVIARMKTDNNYNIAYTMEIDPNGKFSQLTFKIGDNDYIEFSLNGDNFEFRHKSGNKVSTNKNILDPDVFELLNFWYRFTYKILNADMYQMMTGGKASRKRRSSHKASKKASRKGSKKSSRRKSSKMTGGKSRSNPAASKKGSRRRSSRKASKKSSRRRSRKSSKKQTGGKRRASRKVSKKASKKSSRRRSKH